MFLDLVNVCEFCNSTKEDNQWHEYFFRGFEAESTLGRSLLRMIDHIVVIDSGISAAKPPVEISMLGSTFRSLALFSLWIGPQRIF